MLEDMVPDKRCYQNVGIHLLRSPGGHIPRSGGDDSLALEGSIFRRVFTHVLYS
jgi:hypothetical protein